MRQLHTQERRRVRRNSPRQRRAHAREKRPQTAPGIQAADGPADRGPPLGALKPALHRVDGEDGNPHGHASGAARDDDGFQAELPARHAVVVQGGEFPLDILVGGEVGGGAGPVSSEGHGGTAEDGADAAFFVELANNVGAAGVAGFLAGAEGSLALDLEEDFDALEGGGDEGHGDGGEEAGGGDLGDGEGGRCCCWWGGGLGLGG